jgi:hypothetical protein
MCFATRMWIWQPADTPAAIQESVSRAVGAQVLTGGGGWLQSQPCSIEGANVHMSKS